MGDQWFDYTVIKEKHNKLGFDLYLVDINGLLDRERVYGYDDDTERFTPFRSLLLTGYAVATSARYRSLSRPPYRTYSVHDAALLRLQASCSVSTVITIHNAQYQGWMGWDKSYLYTTSGFMEMGHA